jgi:hypothetical protein
MKIQGIRTAVVKRYQLEKWQAELVQILSMPRALRPDKRHIMGRFSLNESGYYYWTRHPVINEARRYYTKQYFQDDVPDVLNAMKDEALAGNPAAAKLFLEYVFEANKDNDERAENENKRDPDRDAVKTIIKNLTLKIYGDIDPETPVFEGETEPIVRGSADAAQGGGEDVPLEVAEAGTDRVFYYDQAPRVSKRRG